MWCVILLKVILQDLTTFHSFSCKICTATTTQSELTSRSCRPVSRNSTPLMLMPSRVIAHIYNFVIVHTKVACD